MHRSSIVLVAASGLLAATLPLIASVPTASAAEATRTITTKQPIQYNCDYDIQASDGNSFPLGLAETSIRATFEVPSRLYPGQVVAPTDIDIVLRPWQIGQTARGLLGAELAAGSSSDASLEIATAEGQSTQVPLGTLTADRAPIAPEGEEWLIAASGTSPAITVPSTSRIRLSAPETFSLQAVLYKEDGSEAARANLPCTYLPSDEFAKRPSRTIAYLKVSKLYPKLTTKAVPTDVVANRTRPTITVKGYSEKTPTGAVQVREGSRVLATGTLKNGSAAVQLPVFGKKGTRNLTVAYAGDVSNNPVTSTTSITVR